MTVPRAIPLLAALMAFAVPPAVSQSQPESVPTPPAKSPLRWQNFAQTPPSQQQAPQPPSPPQPKVEATSDYMSRMDADRDGRASQAEYVDWMSYAFDARDLDRDGVLSPAELPGGKGQPIAREQHRQRLAERFRKQDANRDGWLDAKELAAPPQ